MKRNVLNYFKSFVILLLLSFTVSCKTFIPNPIVDNQASWDGNTQNSGVVNYIEGVGFLITEDAANRYTYLSKEMGSIFNPQLKKGEGLAFHNGKYYLSNEYMVKFAIMNRKWKEK